MKKTAVVTGANRGIGLAFCQQLIKEGYNVIGLCRKTSSALNQLNISVIENIDVTNLEAVKELRNNLICDHVDLLINNAGIGVEDCAEEMEFSGIYKHFLTNACGPLAVSRSLAPLMGPGSKIALISSRLASIGDNSTGESYGYRMSKAALNMMGRNLSIDLKKSGVAVAILSPGMVDTDMLRSLGITTGLDAAIVVQRLMTLLDNLTLENSGTFWHIDGSTLSW